MTRIVPVRKHTVQRMPLKLMALLLAMAAFSYSRAGKVHVDNRDHVRDTITVQKQTTSKKYKIRLYPSATQEVLLFSASGKEGRVYQLFLFNLEGRLVKQFFIRNKETIVIDKMDKGDYLFEVFSDDERIENGQVIVR